MWASIAAALEQFFSFLNNLFFKKKSDRKRTLDRQRPVIKNHEASVKKKRPQ